MESKYPRPGEPVLSGCCTSRLTINDWCIFFHCTGNRRSRNRSRGQLLVKNPTATTLQFESDFDFETANAQFKDDLTKEVVGMLLFWNKYHCMMQLLRGTYTLCIVFFLFCFLWIAAVEKVESGEAQDSQATQEEETLGDKYYDKAKCFFDNISSDLKPRWWCDITCHVNSGVCL